MGTTLGTIKAGIQRMEHLPEEAAGLVDAVAKMWAVGVRPSGVEPMRPPRGSAVIPRRDYGPKQ